jgi:PAS domain S-box-containing protein
MKNTHLLLAETPPSTNGGASESAAARLGTDSLKVSILMVDDRPDKLLALEAVLGPLGQKLVRANSGKEALRMLLKQDFALILLDVSMPGMDGFETASLIRQRLSSEHTPIIFITAIGNSENHISRGYSLGAVDYITTPIVPDILRAKVSVFVELYKKSELIKRQAEQLRKLEEARHKRELHQVADRLETETRRNRFFTMSRDLLGICSPDGNWLQTNPAWQRLLGFSFEDLAGNPVVEHVHPEDLPLLQHAFSHTDAPVELEARWQHRDGSWRWFHVTLTPFVSEQLLYLFGSDITARKEAESRVLQLNEELKHQVAALTEANRELKAFNYSIAHDLRTPLRSMNGFAQALTLEESGALTESGLDFATRIARSAAYMDRMLQDLLVYSTLSQAELVLSRVSLDEAVHELLSLLSKDLKDLDFEVEVRSPLGEVTAHAPTLKQIISNLVSNALKFRAPNRRPLLRIFTTQEDGLTKLWVEDNGIGIAEEHHERVFRLFTRVHNNDSPGTGIGLSLVRKGAERMGGSAGLASRPGEGSQFWVALPNGLGK